MDNHYGDAERVAPATHEASHLRVTLWPGGVVNELPVRRHAPELSEDGTIRWVPGDDRELLPPELILRDLQTVDLADWQAVTDFYATYGWVGRSAPELFAHIGVRLPEPHREGATHVNDLVAHVTLMRALVSHAIAHLTGERLSPEWARYLPGLVDPTVGTPHPNIGGDVAAWDYFTSAINAGLDVYRTRVEVMAPDDVGSPHEVDPDLYSGMCLQAFNLLAEGLPPRRCANERCEHYFVRQAGRADYGLHRSEGVRYCSYSCARAQTQREYRRRRRKGDR